MAVRAGVQLRHRPEARVGRLPVRERREAALADRLIPVHLRFVGLVHGARADVLRPQIERVADLVFQREAPLHEVRRVQFAIRNGGDGNGRKAGIADSPGPRRRRAALARTRN